MVHGTGVVSGTVLGRRARDQSPRELRMTLDPQSVRGRTDRFGQHQIKAEGLMPCLDSPA